MDEEIRVADRPIECNACLFLIGGLDDIVSDLTFAEKRAVVKARRNEWQIMPFEKYRYYIWRERYFDEDRGEYVYSDEEFECCEIPAISAIITRLDLWP